jgi:hypothetical protein
MQYSNIEYLSNFSPFCIEERDSTEERCGGLSAAIGAV